MIFLLSSTVSLILLARQVLAYHQNMFQEKKGEVKEDDIINEREIENAVENIKIAKEEIAKADQKLNDADSIKQNVP